MKRLIPLLVFLAACTGSGAADSTSETPNDVEVETTTTTVAETTTTTVVEEPPGIEDLPEELQTELEGLIAVAEEVRGLEFIDPPNINVVTTDELARLVREDVEESLEDVDVDEALYDLLGLVEPDTSLTDLYSSVLGEQVAGFYDPDTKQLVVPMREDTFSPLERTTIVHELTHALTDQHFDFGSHYEKLFDEDRFDEAAAYQALIEGDAVASELRYLFTLDADAQRQVIEESFDVESTALESAPRFIQESLIFPYVQGQMFVEEISAGSSEAVDEAYADPPLSSEQIITPSDFESDVPVDIELPELTVDGYDLEYASVWGELGFQLMFNQVLGGNDDASEGWGGDRYAVFFDGENAAMVLEYVGDASGDASEMMAALVDYAGEVIQPDEFSEVWLEGDRVWFVAADDPAVGAGLVDQLAG